jgi:hypothetical protein
MSEPLRNALARDLVLRLQRGSHDELRILEVVLGRLEARRAKAGDLILRQRTNWLAELDDGLIDAVIYCSIETLRARDEELAIGHESARAETFAGERTVISAVPERIAFDDIRDRSPYDGFDVSDAGKEGG